MKWNVLAKPGKNQELTDLLLKNRGITTTADKKEFLDPPEPLKGYSLTKLGVNSAQLKKGLDRIRLAIKKKEPVVIYGDYDADGICATAIMWEALSKLGAKVLPFIPSREKEGYGLSTEGIKSLASETKLIITVDNGVVAHEAVKYANSQGVDVVIIDHHEKPKPLPKSLALIHTAKLCAGGIAYFVAAELGYTDNLLELAAIATITDLLPLIGPNRSIVKFGLEAIRNTPRVGLRALFTAAGIQTVGTYEIGYMIGPRLNASGRIESALAALRLLCTSSLAKATELAATLNETNKDRQAMTEEMSEHAKLAALSIKQETDRILVIDNESYHQGVIGLVAGKLVEEYYLPAIVIARGETVSKASARSIAGFNIIEAIRTCDSLLINSGGHPMAAGFSIETTQIEKFRARICHYAKLKIKTEMLERSLRVDTEVSLSDISLELYQKLAGLAPFGLGNPEPVFASQAIVRSMRLVGQTGKHLKLTLTSPDGKQVTKEDFYGHKYQEPEIVDAIAFNQGAWFSKLKVGDRISVAYSVALDTYNSNNRLQLKIKDILSL